jgi:hypothetical protein
VVLFPLLVVPLEKLLTEGAAVLDAAEAIRKIRSVLHGSELAFRIGIVVGDIRSAVAFGDTQVGHQKGDRLGLHDPAAVGVNGELAGRNPMLANGFFDELLGQFGGFPVRDHPAGNVTAYPLESERGRPVPRIAEAQGRTAEVIHREAERQRPGEPHHEPRTDRSRVGGGGMINRTLSKRLERLETRSAPEGEPLVIEIEFVSPIDGSATNRCSMQCVVPAAKFVGRLRQWGRPSR